MEDADGGELFDLMQRTIRERDVKPLFRQLAHAVGYIHSKGYCHGYVHRARPRRLSRVSAA